MKLFSFHILSFLILWFIAGEGNINSLSEKGIGQKDTGSCSVSADSTCDGLFENSGIFEINLEVDLDSLIKDVGEDPAYHKGILSYIGEHGENVSLNVELSTRGKFRKNPHYCDFPPLKIVFDTVQTFKTYFEHLNGLKIVTHCQTCDERYEQYLLQEYLIYRLYGLISDISFKVRLLHINYIPSRNRKDTLSRFAFFIEDLKCLAARVGGRTIKLNYIKNYVANLNAPFRLSLFQYMILNQDWSVTLPHNISFVWIASQELPVPVPFDFDYAGIINIPYDIPRAPSDTDTIPRRKYIGIRPGRKERRAEVAFFDGKKEEIFDLCRNFPSLNQYYREKTIKSIDKFYEIIHNRRKLKKALRNKKF